MKNLHVLVIAIASMLSMGCSERKPRVFPIDGFAVAGTATYQKQTPTVGTFGISKETSEAPIPYAKILVVDTTAGNEVIAEGMTNRQGEFIVGLPEDRMTSALAVRVLSVSALKNFPMAVLNQDSSPETYFFQSDVFIGSKNNLDLFINDGVITNLEGAFNVFSQIMRAYLFMIDFGGESGTQFPELEVRWEQGDTGAADCTCFFKQFLQPSTISLRQDEDDDAVIIHEFGHYIHRAFSRNTSPGGLHIISCNQDDDPQLTWSEGWATGFSLIVRKSPYYVDTGNQTFSVEHENPCHIGQGATSETVVAAMYLDLFDGANNGFPSQDGDTLNLSFEQIWSAMKRVQGSSSLTVYDYYQSLLRNNYLTREQWASNFNSIGLTEGNMLANRVGASSSGIFAPDVPPEADPEFHSTLR